MGRLSAERKKSSPLIFGMLMSKKIKSTSSLLITPTAFKGFSADPTRVKKSISSMYSCNNFRAIGSSSIIRQFSIIRLIKLGVLQSLRHYYQLLKDVYPDKSIRACVLH